MPESLTDQFISDLYTSLIHLSGSEVGTNLNKIFDGAGNSTGLGLSGDRVVINNYIYPEGGLNTIEWLDAFFPVGCIQLTFNNINPQTRIAGTTWEHVAEGRFIVGVGGCYTDSNDVRVNFAPGDPTASNPDPDSTDAATTLPRDGNDAGEFRVTLTTEDLPSHTHVTNIHGVNVQIDSPTGSGSVFEATNQVLPGEINSSDRFRAEQDARNRLAAAVGWNFSVPSGYPTNAHPQYKAFFDALDLNFKRGSSTNYPEAGATGRAAYTTADRTRSVAGLEWQEMVGLWNGETRFIPTHCDRIGNNDGSKPEIRRNLGPVGWVNQQTFGGVKLGQLAINATNAAFLINNQDLPRVVGGPNQAILQHTDEQAFRTSTRVGLGAGHNNIPPSYGAYVWKRIT